MQTMQTRLRRQLVFWRDVWRAAPGAALGAIACIVVGTAATYGVMLGAGHVIAALTARSDTVWRWLWLTVGCLVIAPVCDILRDAFGQMSQRGTTVRQSELIARTALQPHGIAHLETPDSAAELRGLSDHVRSSLILTSTAAVWQWLHIRAAGLAAIAAVATWSWIAATLLVLMQLLHSQAFTNYLRVVQDDLVKESKVEGRRMNYLLGLLQGRQTAKEARLFGLTDWVLDRYNALWDTSIVGIRGRRKGALRPALASDVLSTVGNLAVLLWLAYDAWHGHASVATVVIAAQGIAGVRAFGPLGDTSVSVQRAFTIATQVRDLADRAGQQAHVAGGAAEGTRISSGCAAAVELHNVSFSYPSRTEPVFEGLDLAIPAGQSVAVVGVNGVGKSTLIKLLCGLYGPDSGTVRIDGRDPFTDDDARRRVAVIFQDFVRYQLDLRHNIGIPLLPRGDIDDRALQTALGLAAGTDLVDRIGGWDVPLDPSYAGGTDLSGGQWQRVALARALAAVEAGAGVLVLDEPTAALDVRAEAAIFDRFLEVTGGVTSILVSHRLSSVRHAERIVVLGPAGIVEDGSHDELLRAGGVYAQLFRLQAARFEAGRDA